MPEMKLEDILQLKSGWSTVGQIVISAQHLSLLRLGRYAELREYMKKNGCPKPILVKDGRLLDGIHRAVIAYQLGFESLPVTSDPVASGAMEPR
jgi:hypothetical protein